MHTYMRYNDFLKGKHLADEKMLDKLHEKVIVSELVTVR